MIEIDITLVNRIADGSHIESIDSVAHAEDIVTLGAYYCSVGDFQDALSRYVGVIRSCQRDVVQGSRHVALEQHDVAHRTFLQGGHLHRLVLFRRRHHLESIDVQQAQPVEVDRTRDELRHIGLPLGESDGLTELTAYSDGVAQTVVAGRAIDIDPEFHLAVEAQFLGLRRSLGLQRVKLHDILCHVIEDGIGLVAQLVDEHEPHVGLLAGIDGHGIEARRLGLERVAFLHLEADAHVAVLVKLCRHLNERGSGGVGAGRYLQVAVVLDVGEVVEQTA